MMKNFKILSAIAVMLISAAAFAEPHLDEAIKHATEAVKAGKAGKSHDLVMHAEPAMEHALSADTVAHGPAKGHFADAITDLEEAIKHGKMLHGEIATTYAETALEHLKAANKK